MCFCIVGGLISLVYLTEEARPRAIDGSDGLKLGAMKIIRPPLQSGVRFVAIILFREELAFILATSPSIRVSGV